MSDSNYTETGTLSEDASAQLQMLEQRKSTLEQMVEIARSLQSLREALQAAAQLGTKVTRLPTEVLHLFEQLKTSVESLDNQAVRMRISALDLKLVFELDSMLKFAAGGDTALVSAEQKLLKFRRLAQTSVALRVLLDRRGYPVPALPELAEQKSLKQQLKSLQLREERQRQHVIDEINHFSADIHQLILSSSGDMKAILVQVAKDLILCEKHLLDGKSILDLPVDVANIQLSASVDGVDISAVPVPEDASVSAAEETDAVIQAVEPLQGESVSANSESTGGTAVPEEPESVGWWQRFMHWLDSPWSVGWKDTDDKNKHNK